jgi:outer membrane receptor protein involved in Fe transport
MPLDFWAPASTQMQPQSGNEFSIGYFQSIRKDDWELSADLFYRTMNHCVEFFQSFPNEANGSYTDNIYAGNGRSYGLEILLKKNYGRLTGWLSYTLGRSERTFEEINQGKTFPARFDRRHDLSLVSSYSFNEKWDASIVYVYATGNAYTLPSSWYFINNTPVKEYGDYNSARMPAYNRTDLSVNYWYRKDNAINFSIFNVFMLNNPIYIFMNVEQEKESGNIQVDVAQKKLYTLIPSVSWRFKF